jgi:hypothetical protein
MDGLQLGQELIMPRAYKARRTKRARSRRFCRMLSFWAQGRTHAEVAATLGVSLRTVHREYRRARLLYLGEPD